MKTWLFLSFALSLVLASDKTWAAGDLDSEYKRYGIETAGGVIPVARYKLYSLANGNREFIGFVDGENRCTYAYGNHFPLEIVLVSFDGPKDVASEVVKEPSHMQLYYANIIGYEFVIIDREELDPCPNEKSLEIWGQN